MNIYCCSLCSFELSLPSVWIFCLMGLKGGISFVPLLLLLLFVVFYGGVSVSGLNIWPLPVSVSNGQQSLVVSNDFHLNTHYPDSSSILTDAFSRLVEIIQIARVVEGNVSLFDHSLILQGINVVISSNNEQVFFFFSFFYPYLY